MSEHLFDLFRLELLADLAPEYLHRVFSSSEHKSVGEKIERKDIAPSATGIPEFAQALLGSALLGDRLRSVEYRSSERQDGPGLPGASPRYTKCR